VFFQKGFRGTEKSAFDILKDIVDENEDDSFFSSFDDFGMPNAFKSTFKTFLDDNIFNNENDTTTSFFDSYKPTFMNPNFFMEPPGFDDMEFVDEQCTTHFFSFLSTNGGEQTYSRTSSAVFQNGKVTTSTKDRFQDGTNVYEKAEAHQFTSKKCSKNIYDSMYTAKVKDPSVIIIDDDLRSNLSFNCREDSESFTGFSFGRLEKELSGKTKMKEKLNEPSKKIAKNNKESLRLVNKKPSKKSKS